MIFPVISERRIGASFTGLPQEICGFQAAEYLLKKLGRLPRRRLSGAGASPAVPGIVEKMCG
jgi:hypothetical protein